MKKFITTLLLSLILSFGFSQSVNFDFPKNGSYDWQNSVGPGQSSTCGVNGLYMGVSRSNYANKYGSYEYVIYIASNSYTTQREGCYLGYTYATNINIYYWNTDTKQWELPLYFSTLWVNAGASSPLYTIYSANPNLYLKIKIGQYYLTR